MNKRIPILIPLLFAGLILAPTTDLRTVERIIDGDTIVLKGGERIRYIGIDTPEMTPEQPFAKAATVNLTLYWLTGVRYA